MTQTFNSSEDYTHAARRPTVLNHLKNGNFLDLPKEYTPELISPLFGDPSMFRARVFRTVHPYHVQYITTTNIIVQQLPVPGFSIESQPEPENTLAFWDVGGASGRASFNEDRESPDGGNLLRVVFNEDGTITLSQSIESFNKFRGKPITLAVSGGTAERSVKVTMMVDTGGETLESRPFFSEYFGFYSRLIDVLEVPLDISKFEVTIKLEGREGASVDLSGAVLAIGAYSGDLPYADNIADKAMPSGIIIGWTGDACPPGFRSIEDDAYLLPFHGDPNAFRGRLLTNRNFPGDYPPLGEYGDLTVGDHAHVHAWRELSQTVGGMRIGPVAFDPIFTAFDTLITDGPSMPERDVRFVEQDPDFIGAPELLLYGWHQHIVRFEGDEVHPPHIKLRFCEKI